MERTTKKILMTMLIPLIGLPLLGFVSQLFATLRDRRRFRPPGHLVDVGGFRLLLNIMGEEQTVPTVLLDRGWCLSHQIGVGPAGNSQGRPSHRL